MSAMQADKWDGLLKVKQESMFSLSGYAAAGHAFAELARVLNDFSLSQHRPNACIYTLGSTFTQTWMD